MFKGEIVTEDNLLYRNGKFVGIFPYSGNDEIDAQSAKELLAKLGLLNNSTSLEAIIRQAKAFEEATDVLFCAGKSNLTVPFVVNGSFCIELYLKAIYVANDCTKEGHNLVRLYNELPKPIKLSIEREYKAQISKNGISSRHENFETAIKSLSNCFVQWRYFHERAATSVVNTAEISNIIFTLKKILESAK